MSKAIDAELGFSSNSYQARYLLAYCSAPRKCRRVARAIAII
jgi:hypothetical protein